MKNLATLILAFLVTVCGQDPSFTENTDRYGKDEPASTTDEENPPVEGSEEERNSGNRENPGSGENPGGRKNPNTDGGETKPTEPTTASENFNSSEIDRDQVDLTVNQFRKEFTLRSRMEMFEKSYSQINREELLDVHTQGSSAGDFQQTFRQASPANTPLDILIVVDNSGSMRQEQNNLSAKLNPLLSYAEVNDWQIGIITTDPADRCLRDLIKKGDSDIYERFKRAIAAGTQGADHERGFLMMKTGIEGIGCSHGKWIRPNSMLAILIVSDEDNCSKRGQGCAEEEDTTTSFIMDYISEIRAPKIDAKVYGLIKHPSQGRFGCLSAQNTGTQYAEVISETSGQWGSICSGDYSETLRSISEDVSTTLINRFELNFIPNLGSLRVRVNGVDKSSDTKMVGKTMQFELGKIPEYGARIDVNYESGGSPVSKSFGLSEMPSEETIDVIIDGTRTRNGWNYFRRNNKIVFDRNPADRASILISYRKKGTLKTSFRLPESPDNPMSVEVKVNGRPGSGFHFNSSRLVFDQAPADGARIFVRFENEKEPILGYPINESWGNTVKVHDMETSELIEVRVEVGHVFFGLSDFQNGREVVATGSLYDEGRMRITLENEPIPQSVQAVGRDRICEGADFISVDGLVVDISGCEFDMDEEVRVKYQFEISRVRTFTLESISSLDSYDSIEWTVLVNGLLWLEFETTRNVVTLIGDVPMAAQIQISATY